MKNIVVMSGGGSKQAWGTGALRALLESGRKYDISSGVSAGALNSAFLAQYSPDEQLAAISELEKIWLNLSGDSAVFKRHAPSFLTYLYSFWKGGIFDMSPLRNLIGQKMSVEELLNSKTELMIGVCSLNTGKYKTIDKYNSNIMDYIWASCVFPILFSPVKIDDEMWVDGGIRHQIPLSDVLRIPDVERIDVILSSPSDGHIHDTTPSDKFSNIMNVATRGAGILSDEIYVGDLKFCAERKIEINIFEPSGEVNKDSFKFDREEIAKNLERGYKETKEKLGMM